jgi:hypothetical protein
MNGGLSDEDYQRILAANPDWQPADDDLEMQSFGAAGMRSGVAPVQTPQQDAGATAQAPRFFDKPESEQYLTGDQKKAMKQKLYAYLADKMSRRGQVTSSKAYNAATKDLANQRSLYDAGNLLSAMSKGASMAGTLGGKRAESDIVPAMNEGLYQSTQGMFNNMRALRGMEEQSNMNDLNVARYVTELERGDEQRKDRRAALYEEMLQRRERGNLEQRRQAEVERANKAREQILLNRPGPGSASYTPIATGEGGVLLINPKNPSDTRTVELPKGFTPKGSKDAATPTESERKAGLQAEVSMKELPFLEEIEKSYRPGARDALAGAIGGTLGNYAYTDVGRRYEAAAKRILDPMIRAMSGANAPQAEVDAKRESYIIRPGDDEDTITRKLQARREFVEALKKSAGRGVQSEMPPPADEIKEIPGKGRFKKVPGGWQKVP